MYPTQQASRSPRTVADLVKPPHIRGRSSYAQLFTKHAPFATRGLSHSISKASVVTLAVGLLDGTHVVRVPVITDKTRDEQFSTETVLARCTDCVVQQEGVSDGSVDDAVENMREEFTLRQC